MSYGFLATNNNNQILVSSDTRNLHFIQKISEPTEVLKSIDYYGGIRLLRYRTTCNITPVPFFTAPDVDSFYGTTRVTNAGGDQWDIEIIKSGGTSGYPEVYVFADPRGSSPTDSHGMLVYRDDGTPSFDSRLQPLAVTGGLALTHPSNPKPTFPYGLDPKYCQSSDSSAGGVFQPDQYINYSISLPTKPMFFYPTLAQAQREAVYGASEEECDGGTIKGECIGARRIYSWFSYYWAFYRGAIRRVGNSIDAGWAVVSYGCRWTYSKDGSFIGIGTGGDSGEGGSWAYSNETLNLSAATLIVGDASRYD